MKAEDVQISVSPWVTGMRAEYWGGLIQAQLHSPPGRYAECFDALVEVMQSKAARQDCNWIVNAEFSIDPWGKDGCLMWAQGQGAILAPVHLGSSYGF